MLWMISLAIFLSSPTWAQQRCENYVDQSTISEFSSFLENTIKKLEGTKGKWVPPCPKLSEIPETFLLLFEGAGGYDPYDAALDRFKEPHVNSKKKGWWESSHYKALLNKKYAAKERLGHKITDSLLEGSFIPIANMRKNIFWNYYAHGHVKEAAQCIIKLKAEAHKQNRPFKVKIAGYSMGGGAAIKLAQELEKHHIEVDSVFTVDPVARSFHSLSSLFGKGRNKKYFRRPANLKKWVNFYQHSDTRSLLVGIRGHSDSNADVNLRVSTSNDPSAHNYITEDGLVRKSFYHWLKE